MKLKIDIPDPRGSEGLKLVVSVRAVGTQVSQQLPKGTRMVCAFVVNNRAPTVRAYQSNAFQAQLKLRCDEKFVARPDLHSGIGNVRQDDFDEQVAHLHYRAWCDCVWA